MSRLQWVLIIIAVVLVLAVVFVLVAKPTLVLPAQTVTLAANSPLLAYQRQMKINDLNLRVRSDGKAFVVGDGKDLAQIGYTPASLLHTLQIAERMGVEPQTSRYVRAFALVFPDVVANLWNTGLMVYYVLPMEMTIRFIPG